MRCYLIQEDVKSFIEVRDFGPAAYWLGYADAMIDFQRTVGKYRRPSNRGHMKAWAY